MDELLHDRIKQLKAIEDRLDAMLRGPTDRLPVEVLYLKNDLVFMILEAERQHAEF